MITGIPILRVYDFERFLLKNPIKITFIMGVKCTILWLYEHFGL